MSRWVFSGLTSPKPGLMCQPLRLKSSALSLSHCVPFQKYQILGQFNKQGILRLTLRQVLVYYLYVKYGCEAYRIFHKKNCKLANTLAKWKKLEPCCTRPYSVISVRGLGCGVRARGFHTPSDKSLSGPYSGIWLVHTGALCTFSLINSLGTFKNQLTA